MTPKYKNTIHNFMNFITFNYSQLYQKILLSAIFRAKGVDNLTKMPKLAKLVSNLFLDEKEGVPHGSAVGGSAWSGREQGVGGSERRRDVQHPLPSRRPGGAEGGVGHRARPPAPSRREARGVGGRRGREEGSFEGLATASFERPQDVF